MDFGKIARAAKDQGWRTDEGKGKTLFYSPDGKTIVTWHHTTSDHRALRNFLSRMRQGGLEWPPGRKRG